jgi:hypothetical protein
MSEENEKMSYQDNSMDVSSDMSMSLNVSGDMSG